VVDIITSTRHPVYVRFLLVARTNVSLVACWFLVHLHPSEVRLEIC
jgi:hypothetical protein